MRLDKNDPIERNIKNAKDNGFPFVKVMALGIIAVVAIISLISAVVVVPAGTRGVVMTFGAVENRILGEGLTVITPYVESVQIMDVKTLKYDVEASAATKDLLDVTTKATINYHISPTAVNSIYQTVGMDFENKLIAPAVQETIKASTATFNAEELITQRPAIKQLIETRLKEVLLKRDIIVEVVQITDLKFPQQFNDAITSKQTAVQKALQAENDLRRITVEAEQAVAKAKGDAEAIDIVNQQLMKSQQYIQYIAVNKWNGIMPLATGGTLPFIQIPIGNNAGG